MVEKICKCCGKLFIAETNRKRLCDTCRKANREKHSKEYCVQYKKEKLHSINISKEDFELMERITKLTKMSKREIVHQLLEEYFGIGIDKIK